MSYDEPVLTFCHIPTILDPNAKGESQLTFDSNPASGPRCRSPFGTTPMLVSSDMVPRSPAQKIGYPSLILPSDLAPRFEGLFITDDNFQCGIRLAGLTISTLARESMHLIVGQIGPLQEYRHGLATNARSLVLDLQKIETSVIDLQNVETTVIALDGFGPTVLPVAPYSSGIYSAPVDACVPSLKGRFALTQYFDVVRDELFTLNCETRIALRKALTAVDRLLGCVDHVILEIRRSALSNIRLFCSVSWEKRTWFLYHGARPPKTSVQVILGLFAGACSGSRIAN